MSFAFPNLNHSIPHAVILTLGTDDGTILVRLHTTNNNLHVFATFISREHFDTRFLWTNIRPNHITGDFDISHQTVTVATDAQEAFSHIRQNRRHFRVDPTPDASELGDNEEENPPAPPYEPSPPQSQQSQQSFHYPAVQHAEQQTDQQPEVTNNETEAPRMEEETREQDDSSSEQYWRAVEPVD